MHGYLKKHNQETSKKMETIKHYKTAISRFYGLCHYFFNAGSLEEHERLFMDILEVFDMCYRYKRDILQKFCDADDNPFVEGDKKPLC